VSYFFSLALSEANHRKAQKNYENTKSLYAIAEQRLKIGTISKDELLQLELRMLNDSLSINNTALSLREQQMRLTSFLRLKENTTIEPIINEEIPVIALDYEMVLSKALSNSSFELENEISLLNAEASIAQAKANRGASASFNARFGLSQTASELGAAYANLLDQEVVGLQFSVPIFDWGMGKGRVKMAKARAEMTRSQIEQAEIDYRHEVYTLLEQFTNQRNQCEVSRRAQAIALDRYAIAMDNFRRGTLSVTEMNTAQSEKDSAEQTYISSLATFWNYYYQLRRLTLYDFMTKTDIEAEFEKIIKE
jgi:outer membrane protein TolC